MGGKTRDEALIVLSFRGENPLFYWREAGDNENIKKIERSINENHFQS